MSSFASLSDALKVCNYYNDKMAARAAEEAAVAEDPARQPVYYKGQLVGYSVPKPDEDSEDEDECCLKCGADEAIHTDHTGSFCDRCWEHATYCDQCDEVVWMDECFVDDETGKCLCEACKESE